MFIPVQRIKTENSTREIWRLLRLFTDEVYSYKKLCTFHNIKPDEHQKNVKKQAKQIGYCIRQAEEYFQAYNHVSLLTSPLMLYYGIVNLSQALVLFKQDGNHSLDKLQKDKKHKHHGLNLNGEVTKISEKDNIENILTLIQFSVEVKENKPWGQFGLFYKSLDRDKITVKYEIIDERYPIREADKFCLVNYPKAVDIKTFFGEKIAVLKLFKNIPELYDFLQKINIQADICELCHYSIAKEILSEDIFEEILRFDIMVNEAEVEKKKKIEDLLKGKLHCIIQSSYPHFEHRIFKKEIHYKKLPNIRKESYYPSIIEDISVIEDINGKRFLLLSPDFYIAESANYFIILYCLGMLARYYPNIWVKTIETNILFAELVRNFLEIAYRKFPHIILNQLTGEIHYINAVNSNYKSAMIPGIFESA